jgi:hypothetical protein
MAYIQGITQYTRFPKNIQPEYPARECIFLPILLKTGTEDERRMNGG